MTTIGEQPKSKPFLSKGYLLLIVFAVLALAFACNFVVLWNIHHDLKYLAEAAPSVDIIVLPVVASFTRGLPASLERLYQSIETSSTHEAKPVQASDYVQVETAVPDFPVYYQRMLQDIDKELAAGSQTFCATAVIAPEGPVPLLVNIPVLARIWTYMAFSQIEKRPASEVCKIFLGAAHLGSIADQFHMLMGRMVGTSCWDVAVNGILRSAKYLMLSIAETRDVILALKRIQDRIWPLSEIWRLEKIHWRNDLLWNVNQLSKDPIPDILLYSPGFITRNLLLSDAICQSYETELIDPYLELTDGPWNIVREKMRKLHDHAVEIQNSLQTPTFSWVQYFFNQPKYFFYRAISLEPSAFLSLSRAYFSKQYFDAAIWALGVYGYFHKNGVWPTSQKDVEDCIGLALPKDYYSGKEFLFKPGSPPEVRGVGPDMIPGTDDDVLCIFY